MKISLYIILSIFIINNQTISQSYRLSISNAFGNELDIFLGYSFEYAQGQFVIEFPLDTPPDLKFSVAPDCSEIYYYQIPETLEYDSINKLLIIRPNAAPGPGHGTISPVGGDRIAKINIFSEDPFFFNPLNIKWRNKAIGSSKDYTRIYAYINSQLTEITDSNNHIPYIDPPLGFSTPYTPSLISPSNYSTVSSFPLWLVCYYYTWITYAYRVQIAEDFLFLSKVIDGFYYGNTIWYDSISISSLAPNTKYYWRVNVHNFYAISPFSSTWSFTTDDLTNINNSNVEIPDKFSLKQNYPNPFNPVTNLEFGISDVGFASLIVYDISGKEIATLVNNNLNPGTYKFEFDASDLSSGIYFYSLKVNSYIETKRMILLK